MPDRPRAGQDVLATNNRLHSRRSATYVRRSIDGRTARLVMDVLPPQTVVASGEIPVPAASQPTRSKSRVNAKTFILTTTAVFALAGGVFVSLQTFKTNKNVEAQVKSLSSQVASTEVGGVTTDIPSEDKPSDAAVKAYQVAPEMPRYLRINKIGVATMVKRVGNNDKGEIAVPNNIHITGWYDGSSKPGEASGAAFMSGHVHGLTQPGSLYDMKKLTEGDKIEVELGSGKKLTYRVVKKKTYEANTVDMAEVLGAAVPGKPGLNIMTCAGIVKPGTVEYSQRLVVFTVQE